MNGGIAVDDPRRKKPEISRRVEIDCRGIHGPGDRNIAQEKPIQGISLTRDQVQVEPEVERERKIAGEVGIGHELQAGQSFCQLLVLVQKAGAELKDLG